MTTGRHSHEELFPIKAARTIVLIVDENHRHTWLIVPKNKISIPVLIKGRVKGTLREFQHFCLRSIGCGPSIDKWVYMDDLYGYGVPKAYIPLEAIEEHRTALRQLNVHRTFGIGLNTIHWMSGEPDKSYSLRKNYL